VLIDDVVDGAVKAGTAAVAARKAALYRIVETSGSYDEMRERIKKLYFDARPTELREVLETAMQVSHLIGHAAARVDHRGDLR
jgi:phage gp29-like protein